MKCYVKLVNFELNRFFNLYLIVMGLTIVCQMAGAVIISKGYMKRAVQVMYEKQIQSTQYIKEYGAFNFHNYFNSPWFLMPIFFCITLLVLYVFFIWYREWFGKNTFIYRLLMLPTNRVNIYSAKLTTIMMLVLGLVALQLFLLTVEIRVIKSIVSEDFRTSFSFHGQNLPVLAWLYPMTFTDFLLSYGLGLIFVAIIFTAILFERSYRIKGIFFAIAYGILSFGVVILPITLNAFFTNYFYTNELIVMQLAMGVIVLGSAFWLANHLLKHKIRV